MATLNTGESMGFTSMSFPVLGAGQKRYPEDLVVTIMVDTIVEFSSVRTETCLKDIFIVIAPNKTKLYKVSSFS